MYSLNSNVSVSLKNHPKLNQLVDWLIHPPRGIPRLEVSSDGHQCNIFTRKVLRKVAIESLLAIWTAAKEFAPDGVFNNVKLSYLDDLADYPGFGEAMVAAGWAKYDKKGLRITLYGPNNDAKDGVVKKSPGAIRQQKYRLIQRLRKLAAHATMGVWGKHGPKYNPGITTVEFTYDETGAVTSYGSITIDGVVRKVMVSQPQRLFEGEWPARRSVTIEGSSVTHPVTLSDSGVTQGVTQGVMLGDSGVSQSVTQGVTLSDSGVTQSVTEPVTLGDSGVTEGVTHPVTLSDSGVTQGVTQGVTLSDSGVTQSVTEPVTLGDSGVTEGVTHPETLVDSGVTQNVTRYVPEPLACVIPSRAYARFSFLRSKTLRSKHKTTHNAREENFGPVDKSNPVSRIGLKPCGSNSLNSSLGKLPRPKIKTPHNAPDFEAMHNETQSITLWQNGFSATCVTRKPTMPPAQRSCTNNPVQPKKFRLDSAWIPSEKFLENAQYIGILLTHEASDYEVAEFVEYWTEEGAEHTQKQWETKLARFIGKGRKRVTSKPSRRKDFTLVSNTDYAIPEGFHGG